MTQEKLLVTVNEAATLLSRSPRSIYNMINEGIFPVVQRGRRKTLLVVKDLEEWIEKEKTYKVPEEPVA